MREAEALEIVRTAVLAAQRDVGDNRHAWYAEILRRAEKNPRLKAALTIVGALTVHASQSEKQ